MVTQVGERRATVLFQPGSSFAEVRSGIANLDGGILKGNARNREANECLLGLAAHEGAHLKWSRRPKERWSRLYRWVYNLLEDERIEALLVKKYPPLINPLHVARRELIQIRPRDLSFFSTLFGFVRAPHLLTPEQWATHRSRLLLLRQLLDPFPMTAKDLLAAISLIIELIPKEELEGPLPEFPELIVRVERDPADRRNGEDDAEGRPFRGGKPRFPRRSRVDPNWPPVTWTDVAPDPVGYEEIRQQVVPQAAVLREHLHKALPRRPETGFQQGRLDRRRLHQVQTNTRLFRRAEARKDLISLALIIDLSSSMRGREARLAGQIGVMVAEAVRSIPEVRFFAYGHAADRGRGRGTEICRFAAPAKGPAFSLGRLPVGGNNRDAHAFELIGRELCERDRSARGRRVALIISDGIPAAIGFEGPAACEATKGALAEFEQCWGPVVLLATSEGPLIQELKSGPEILWKEDHPVEGLVQLIDWCLKRH
jgi:hypothetical protein